MSFKFVHLLRRLVGVISTLSLTNKTHRPLSIWSWLVSVYSSNALSTDLGWQLYSSTPTENVSGRVRTSRTTSLLQPTHPHDKQCSPLHLDTIHRLMNNPTLFDPARAPRYPIVLCHGLYGFDVRSLAAFPSLRLHYWSSVLSILKHKLGAEVIVTGVPATGSIASRAESLDRILQQRARGRGINLMGHSMGGLDCRHLITHIRPTEYAPLSLTSISTPHRGSPFMDWCVQYLGLGRRQHELTHQNTNGSERQTQPEDPISATGSNGSSEKRETAFRLSLSALPSSFTTLLLSLIDSPAYANLTTSYLNDVFNPSTPDDPRVKYFSVASRVDDMCILHPLWFPKIVLDDTERKARKGLESYAESTSYRASIPPREQETEWGNDGLVTVQSARWGEFLGIVNGCDHWEIRGAGRMEMNVEFSSGIGSVANRIAGEGWDWPRFVSTWKRQDRGPSDGLDLAQAAGIGSSDAGETGRTTQDSRNDPIVKASTEKLSAVFDWIVEHVPTSGSTSAPEERVFLPKETVRFDLERFYVALTRKLYEEGL